MPLTASTIKQADGFTITPVNDRSLQFLTNGTHALIGVSPFNSRFSLDYLRSLFSWAQHTFVRFDVLLAGADASLQLEALGTPAGKARYKARGAVRRNRRDVTDTLSDLGLTSAVDVHAVDDFVDSTAYRRWRDQVTKVFAESDPFRTACLEMSRKAIAGRQRSVTGSCASVDDKQAQMAVGYVLAELPFFVATPDLLDVPASVLVYHRPWELGEKIFRREVPLTLHPDQGYLTVSPAHS